MLYVLTPLESFALVVRRDGGRVVALAPEAALLEAIARAVDADTPYIRPEAVAALRALVTEPLALGADVERVLVVPAGRLAYVPLALLLPGRETAFVPSGTVLRLLRARGAVRGRGVLAIGDPAYGTVAPTSRPRVRGRALAPLPATRKEVAAVGSTRLLGAEATETRLRAALAKEPVWRSIHFACHGLIDPVEPMQSSLALTPDEESDGLLTCADLIGLRTRAELVVLSACETARGRVYASEGILGLARSFMLGGAPRILCSLWKVDDEATHALMVAFYERWNPQDGGGAGAAAALRAAQAHVRAQARWAHPRYWAAWVLWGLPG